MRRSVVWRRVVAARSGRGAAAVEFALIMPILLVLVFGIISYGYMLSFRQAISQGAAEGARAAAVAQIDANQTTDAIAALNEALDSYGVSCQDADGPLLRNGATVGTCGVVVGPCENDTSVDCATVTVDYAYRDHALIPVPLINGLTLPEHLKYSAVARVS